MSNDDPAPTRAEEGRGTDMTNAIIARSCIASLERECERLRGKSSSAEARATQAEAEVARLRERVATLEAALKPFADCWKPYLAHYDARGCPGWPSMGSVTIADIAAARTALEAPHADN